MSVLIDNSEIQEDGSVRFKLKWFRFNQNNSGGYFIKDELVCEDVFIQDVSADNAAEKARAIFEDGRDDYCQCCGERWYLSVDDDEGTNEPEVYGESIYKASPRPYRKECRLHWFDGRVTTYKYGDPRPPKLLVASNV